MKNDWPALCAVFVLVTLVFLWVWLVSEGTL